MLDVFFSLNWLIKWLQLVFQLISSNSYGFLNKLDIIKTGAGGSPYGRLAVVVVSCFVICSHLFIYIYIFDICLAILYTM